MRTSQAVLVHAYRSVSRALVRSLTTAVGVAIGIAVFISTLGWATTVNAMVNADFDATLATRVLASGNSALGEDPIFRPDFDEAISSMPGVVAAGIYSSEGHPVTLARTPNAEPFDSVVVTATPGALIAAGVTLESGRLYDGATAGTGVPQIVLSAGAARALEIDANVRYPFALEVDGAPVTVLGVLSSFGSQPELALGVLAPPEAMSALGASMESDRAWTAIVRTDLGAANVVAQALPYAINPAAPDAIGVQVPPSPEQLRGSVQTSLNSLAVGAALLSLVVGGIGIMNAMLTAVHQRSSEIGLRRALGARPRHIATQFFAEGTLLGVVGGIVGAATSLGVLVALGTLNDIAPVAERWWFALAPIAGATIGGLASLYPAIRAATIRPAETLRR